MTIIKKKTSENNCCRVCGQTLSIPCSLLLEMQTATATLEISVESSLKAKNKSVTRPSYIAQLHNQLVYSYMNYASIYPNDSTDT